MADPLKNKILYSWSSPNRIVVSRPQWWYLAISTLFLLAVVFAAITREFILIIAIVATFALIFLSRYIKPKLIRQSITSIGFQTSDGRLLSWSSIVGFWVSKKDGQYQLIIDLEEVAPNRMIILVGQGDPYKIVESMITYVPYITKEKTGENIINTFTFGTYVPYAAWIEAAK